MTRFGVYLIKMYIVNGRRDKKLLASLWESRSSGFLTRSDTNRVARPQKMARGLKFRIYEVEGLHYPCSENKGTDQLREADLPLVFRICKKPVSHNEAHMKCAACGCSKFKIGIRDMR